MESVNTIVFFKYKRNLLVTNLKARIPIRTLISTNFGIVIISGAKQKLDLHCVNLKMTDARI